MSYAPDLTTATLKMVLSLSVVLLLLWGLHRWLKRALPAGRAGGKGRLIKVLGSHYLGMKKSIAVVQVPGSVLVLGIGTEQVNLLTRIDDPDVIAGLQPTQQEKGAIGFREQLQRMTRNFRTLSGGAGPTNDQGTAV